MASAAVVAAESQDTDARTLLSEEERAKMIARIHSLVYYVGMLIPEHTTLGETEVDLREIVYNLTNKDELTKEDSEQVNQMIRQLKDKAKYLEIKLKSSPMTVNAGKELVEEICGLLRAVEELRTIETPEKAQFRKHDLMNRIEDERRWQKFLEQLKLDKGP